MSEFKKAGGSNTPKPGEQGFQKSKVGKAAPKASLFSRLGKKSTPAKEDNKLSYAEAVMAYDQLKQKAEDIRRAKETKEEQEKREREALDAKKQVYRAEAEAVSEFLDKEKKKLIKKYNLGSTPFDSHKEDQFLWGSYLDSNISKPVVYYKDKKIMGAMLSSNVLHKKVKGKNHFKYELLPVFDSSLDAVTSYQVIDKLVETAISNIKYSNKKDGNLDRSEVRIKVELSEDLACKKLLETGWTVSMILQDDLNYLTFDKLI